MKEDRLALLADARIPPAARVLGTIILEAGQGWHEVSHQEFSAALGGGRSEETIRRHLKSLEDVGWIKRKAGGRAHSPHYRIITTDHEEDGGNFYFRSALYLTAPESVRESDSPTLDGGLSGGYPHTGRGSKDSPTPDVDLRTDSPTPHEGLSTRSSSREEVGEVGVDAREAIEQHGEKFDGCRDSLQDYLSRRVPPGQQVGYVQSLAGWLDGIRPNIWRRPDGGKVPPEERTARLAAALNDLLGSDESTMKRPVGDVANLKTKLGIIIQQEYSDGRRDGGRASSKGKGSESESPFGGPDRYHFGEAS